MERCKDCKHWKQKVSAREDFGECYSGKIICYEDILCGIPIRWIVKTPRQELILPGRVFVLRCMPLKKSCIPSEKMRC